MEKKDHFTNCHRTKGSQRQTNNIPGASDDSDQDSSTSKYVVKEDQRERKDGSKERQVSKISQCQDPHPSGIDFTDCCSMKWPLHTRDP